MHITRVSRDRIIYSHVVTASNQKLCATVTVAQTPAKVSDMQYQFALQLGGVFLVTILYGANLPNLDRTEILLSPP
jgi:hypothetical protein